VTGGAGQRALDRAFEDLFGVARAFAGIELPGRTDPLILADAFSRHLVSDARDRLPEFQALYYRHLAEEMRSTHPAPRALPGVHALLDRCAARDDLVLALLTGNYEPSARLKLQPFDLWRYFRCGAFGDDGPDRDGLVPVAVARAIDCGHAGVTARRTVVIGDTPHDVRCAAAHGARSLAVATGGFSVAALRAAGADAAVDDLSDTITVVGLIEELTS